MEVIAGCSSVDVSGKALISNLTQQQSCIAAENSMATHQTIASTSNPDEFVIEKASVVQQKIIIIEKSIVSKDSFANHLMNSSCSAVEEPPSNSATTDEMDLDCQTGCKMVLGSQESVEQKMIISSQESDSSKMDIMSQEISIDENTESHANLPQRFDLDEEIDINLRDCDQNDLKRKLPDDHVPEPFISSSKSLELREEMVSFREKVVALREAIVNSEEKLRRNLKSGVSYRTDHAIHKRRKISNNM